jgi:hypothetical protein
MWSLCHANNHPVYELEVAETLLEIAKQSHRKGYSKAAQKHLSECIEILESYDQSWDEESAKDILKKATRFRQQIRDQT